MILSVVLCMLAWQRLPDMPASKAQHACEGCGDSIYVAAGGSNGLHVSTMYRYDLRCGIWSECAPAPERVQSPVMRSVNGRLYFIGGHDSTKGSAGGKTNVCAEYDPFTDTWSSRTPMPTAREDMGSAVIGKEIWIFGGLDNRGHDIPSEVEVYDTATDTWSTRAYWANPRCLGDFACTDGQAVYLISGTSTMNGYPFLVPSVVPQVYEDGSFQDLPPMPGGHCYTEVELLDGCIYVFGGADDSTASSSDRIDRFDTRRRIWLDPMHMPYPANSVAAAQHRGRLYLSGGWHAREFLPYFYVMERPESPLPAGTGYGGGHGTADDPYQIWTAEQMNALGAHPEDWGKDFRLMADVDLSDFDGRQDRPAFNTIAPDADPVRVDFQGISFTGVFDGNGHVVSHLTITGEGYPGLFGRVGRRGRIRDLGIVDANVTGWGDCGGVLAGANEGAISYCYGSGVIRSPGDSLGGLIGSNAGQAAHCRYEGDVLGEGNAVGGLVGANSGDIVQSYTTGLVCGNWQVGGLAGQNWDKARPPRLTRLAQPGVIADCYSLCFVGGKGGVGGLVGDNERGGTVKRSYSAGLVAGAGFVGGLAGRGTGVTASFWDVLASGQTTSAGGTGLVTCEMQMLHTFLEAGWDFTREEENGTDDTWWLPGGWDYPRLAYKASFPEPYDGATDILQLPFLRWVSDRVGVEHDIYLGNDESAVLSATSQDSTVYRGRRSATTTLFDPGTLEVGKTYYWRVDGVNVVDFNNPWRGRVWRFSLADFASVATVDDFESYTDDTNAGEAIFQTWTDGAGFGPLIPANSTGSLVGNIVEPFAGQTVVHTGRQALPVIYNNVRAPWYSQVERSWQTPQDWTMGGVDTLTLYFRGEAENVPDRLYAGIEDAGGHMALTNHQDELATATTEWRKWHIPLEYFRTAGLDLSAVRKICIGVGGCDPAQSGGRGTLHVDDIRLTKRLP